MWSNLLRILVDYGPIGSVHLRLVSSAYILLNSSICSMIAICWILSTGVDVLSRRLQSSLVDLCLIARWKHRLHRTIKRFNIQRWCARYITPDTGSYAISSHVRIDLLEAIESHAPRSTLKMLTTSMALDYIAELITARICFVYSFHIFTVWTKSILRRPPSQPSANCAAASLSQTAAPSCDILALPIVQARTLVQPEQSNSLLRVQSNIRCWRGQSCLALAPHFSCSKLRRPRDVKNPGKFWLCDRHPMQLQMT
jgi:hypothetical protein